jgi:poly(A) polymerase
MKTFNLPPCQQVGALKSAIKDAILDGVIPNEYEAARAFMLQRAEKMGLK